MGVITTSNFAKDLQPTVNAWYGQEYKKHPLELFEIFNKETSTKAFEEMVGVTGFGAAREIGENGSITFDSNQQSFVKRYIHKNYGLGYIITKNMYDDGIAFTASLKKATSLEFALRTKKEMVAIAILDRAFNASYAQPDGVELCSEVHPNKSNGSTWPNELATPADISELALEQVCIIIGAFKTDKLLPFAVRPRKVVVCPGDEFDLARVLKSVNQAGTANNDINAVRVLGKFPDGYAVNHYSSMTNQWFVKTDCPNGLTFIERQKDSFDMKNDFDTGNAKAKAVGRYSVGCTDPRAICGSAER